MRPCESAVVCTPKVRWSCAGRRQPNDRSAHPERSPRTAARPWLGVVALGLTSIGVLAARADWPLYRGPTGNGVSTERIRTDWNANPPKLLWRAPLTNGLSSVSVSGGRVFTQVRVGSTSAGTEYCVALDARTGAFLWTAPVGLADYPGGGVGLDDGPRSTPVVKDDRVYVLGSYLNLHCLEAATGKSIWAKDLRAEFGGDVIGWQNAASPLIEGDRLFLNVNAPPNRLVALRLADGGLIWRKVNAQMTHATPVAATIQGERQIVFMAQEGAVGVDPATGQERWRYPFPYNTSTGASPTIEGDLVFCSAAYSKGSGAARITRSGGSWTATPLWGPRSSRMIHWSTPVVVNGYVYGLFELGSIPLRCLDAQTGEDRWSVGGFGRGATLLVSGKILVVTEAGEAVLVEPDPAQYRELARFQALDSRVWNSPAISDGVLFVRGTTEMAAFDLAAPPPPPLRLVATLDRATGRVIFEVANVDGQPIEASRVAGISLRHSNVVSVPVSDWTPAGVTLTLQSGTLRGEFEPPAGEAAMFFAVNEN